MAEVVEDGGEAQPAAMHSEEPEEGEQVKEEGGEAESRTARGLWAGRGAVRRSPRGGTWPTQLLQRAAGRREPPCGGGGGGLSHQHVLHPPHVLEVDATGVEEREGEANKEDVKEEVAEHAVATATEETDVDEVIAAWP